MKALVSKILWGGTTLAVFCAAIALVTLTILMSTGFSMSGMWQNIKSTYEKTTRNMSDQITSDIRSDEVKSYNLFTSVEYHNYVVTTGARFSSTQNPKIEQQWCYITSNNGKGRHTSGLTLATMDNVGRQNIPDFDPASLQKFSLDKKSVQKLIISHCRF